MGSSSLVGFDPSQIIISASDRFAVDEKGLTLENTASIYLLKQQICMYACMQPRQLELLMVPIRLYMRRAQGARLLSALKECHDDVGRLVCRRGGIPTHLHRPGVCTAMLIVSSPTKVTPSFYRAQRGPSDSLFADLYRVHIFRFYLFTFAPL